MRQHHYQRQRATGNGIVNVVNDVVAVIDVGRIKHAAAFDRAINVSS